jgi:hypothetical protein
MHEPVILLISQLASEVEFIAYDSSFLLAITYLVSNKHTRMHDEYLYYTYGEDKAKALP